MTERDSSIIWKAIPGYEDLYEASNQGQVRRLGGTAGTVNHRIKKQTLRRNGYYTVTVSRDTHVRWLQAHRLVASAFLGEIPSGYQVNHKNGVKSDNHISNLEIVTPLENVRHAIETGLMQHRGENNPYAVLRLDQVLEIRASHAMGGCTFKSLAAKYGVKASTIGNVIARKSWAWA